ncbi:VWA domain-containing protein [Alienimonas sp. DA493]|uniref:VWA domain-containing protein n=1 Tax=Alienimonas sp. DA493 TaxID=3373605 RepID=UPI003754627D
MNALSSIGFANLAAGALAALAAPIILFYFLKLRRPRAEVPSLALWRRVVNDKRVNSPFQKFRRNLLLLLQLLLLAALTFAAMQPFLNAGAGRAEYRVILIDASASMAATDAAGRSRLDLAKEKAEELIEGLRPGQQLALIAFDRNARTLQEFTDNPNLLKPALDRLTTKDVESDLGDALRLAGALARTAPVAEAILLTDGNLPPADDVDLAFPVNYQRLPAAGPNVGIVALNARRSGAGAAENAGWDLFVKLAASAATGATVELYGEEGPDGGDPLATESVGFDRAEDSPRLVFEVPADGPRAVTVRIVAEGPDSLPADDTAGLILPPPRPLTAYCPTSQGLFRRAMELEPGAVTIFPRPSVEGPLSYDLAIVDEPDTEENPAPEANVRAFVGVVPPDLSDLIATKVGYAEVVDWRQTAPVLEHVQLREVQITEEPEYLEQPDGEPAGAADLEQLGYEVLIDARTGPLMLRRREGARVDYFLLFDPATSTLPYRVAFPILVQNLVREATRAAALSEVRAERTGTLPEVDLGDPNREATVAGPDGTRTVRADAGGMLTAVPAETAGLYTVSAGGEEVAAFTVGTLSPLETSLVGAEQLEFNEVAVAASGEEVAADRPLWRWLAAGALVLLLAEWWVFHRRPVT